MSDLFTRLAEQTLGRVQGVQPMIASRFAPGRHPAGETVAHSFPWAEAETHEEETEVLPERERPAVFPKPSSSSPKEFERISSSFARGLSDRPTEEPVEENPALPPDRGAKSDKKDGNSQISFDGRHFAAGSLPDDQRQPHIKSSLAEHALAESNLRNHKEVVLKEGSIKRREAPDLPSLSQSSNIDTVSLLSEPYAPRPTVHVTIGRVEVKAIMPTVQPEHPKPYPPGPTLSLEAYLKQRNEGER
jgi:hypothetical protein